MTIKKFFEIEDVGLRKYLYISGNVSPIYSTNIVDNMEKTGFYMICRSLKMNNQGKFYVNNCLTEYIVYKKDKKKVYMSKNTYSVYTIMLNHYFYFSNIISLLQIKPTPTLCKKIIDGSINTIADFMAYLRSYVVRKKELDIVTINKFMERLPLLHVVENPGDIQTLEQVIYPLDSGILASKAFTFRIEDIEKQNKIYEEWNSKNSIKASMLEPGGDDSIRCADGTGVFI